MLDYIGFSKLYISIFCYIKAVRFEFSMDKLEEDIIINVLILH